MRALLLRLLASAVAALLAARPALAAFQDIGAGARAPAMGDTFAAVADDVYAIHYNPAGLSLLRRPELATSYNRLFMGLTDGSTLASSFIGYAYPIRGGEKGTVGTAWEQFSLNSSLYNEQTFYLSYGRQLPVTLGPGELSLGGSLKYLRRSFGNFAEANNALIGNGLQVSPGLADPVLTGRSHIGVPDADLGALYRFPQNYAIGLALTHLMAPNVAFSPSDSDRVPLSMRLGLSYRSILSVLSAQFATTSSPYGGLDKKMSVGAERWFPHLFAGDFAARGALVVGDRDLRQLTLGLGYRSGRFSADYGFALPISGISGTQGTHRFGVTIRFGKATEEEESVQLILEAMRRLSESLLPKPSAPGLSPAQKALLLESVTNARRLMEQAQYELALEKVGEALKLSPNDAGLQDLSKRLTFIVQYIKVVPDYQGDSMQAALHDGILAYLNGQDADAVQKIAYALSLRPDHKGLEAFLAAMEKATGQRRPAQSQGPRPHATPSQEKLIRAADAIQNGRYLEALELSNQVLETAPDNVPALENVGTCQFALANYPESLKAWRKAYSLETDPGKRASQRGYIRSIENLMRRPKPALSAPAKPATIKSNAEEVNKLYQQGVDYYISGNLPEAQKIFSRVLELDPENASAAKALARIKEELAASEKKQ